jgi:hypothetical protein
MLWQIHHQFMKGDTQFVSQFELIDGDCNNDAIVRNEIDTAWKKYPPPAGACFVIGNEEWEHFVWIKK